MGRGYKNYTMSVKSTFLKYAVVCAPTPVRLRRLINALAVFIIMRSIVMRRGSCPIASNSAVFVSPTARRIISVPANP